MGAGAPLTRCSRRVTLCEIGFDAALSAAHRPLLPPCCTLSAGRLWLGVTAASGGSGRLTP